ncbi:MAG: hypothetical protein ACXWC7_06865 [Chitinophagaceae bacterium]
MYRKHHIGVHYLVYLEWFDDIPIYGRLKTGQAGLFLLLERN